MKVLFELKEIFKWGFQRNSRGTDLRQFYEDVLFEFKGICK